VTIVTPGYGCKDKDNLNVSNTAMSDIVFSALDNCFFVVHASARVIRKISLNGNNQGGGGEEEGE
jgi:hypothetical protein